MELVASYLTVTLGMGVVASGCRPPPLVGFLVAGFALNAMGVPHAPVIEVAANLGVTLLLFGIGLQLNPRILLAKEVWVATLSTIAVTAALGMGFLGLLVVLGLGQAAGLGFSGAATLGLGLGFLSTVFVMKLLEQRGDTGAFYGRTQHSPGHAAVSAACGPPLAPSRPPSGGRWRSTAPCAGARRWG